MKNFILEFPTWDGNNYFTNEIIVFVISILAIMAGVLLCFWGYKYFQTLIVVLLGCLSGVASIFLTDYLTKNVILKMCFFVMFTFFGSCVFYFVSILADSLLKILHIKKAIAEKMYIITSLMGAVLVGCIVYLKIYNGLVADVIISFSLAVIGIIYQKKKKNSGSLFHSYEDIYNMKPLEEKQAEVHD